MSTTPQYVIARDFWEDCTGGYSLRQFWNEEAGRWVDIDSATRYPEPMRLNEDDPNEFSLSI